MTILFSKDFYTLNSIKKAIKAYDHLADFVVLSDKKKRKVIVKNIDKSVKDIFEDEFSNYVLSENR